MADGTDRDHTHAGAGASISPSSTPDHGGRLELHARKNGRRAAAHAGLAEPWLSVLSELSELSEHCRSTVGALSEHYRKSLSGLSGPF